MSTTKKIKQLSKKQIKWLSICLPVETALYRCSIEQLFKRFLQKLQESTCNDMQVCDFTKIRTP